MVTPLPPTPKTKRQVWALLHEICDALRPGSTQCELQDSKALRVAFYTPQKGMAVLYFHLDGTYWWEHRTAHVQSTAAKSALQAVEIAQRHGWVIRTR